MNQDGYLLAGDSLRGTAGKAFMTVDGKNERLFNLKKFEANAEPQSSDFKVVGALVTQTKINGIKYSGSASVYYGSPAFVKILQEYKRTGRFPVINFQVENNDQGSSMGAQIMAIYNVVLTKIPLALLDDSADTLQSEVSFTFTDFEVLKWFNDQPSQLG